MYDIATQIQMLSFSKSNIHFLRLHQCPNCVSLGLGLKYGMWLECKNTHAHTHTHLNRATCSWYYCWSYPFNTLKKNPMICWHASANAYAHRFVYFLTVESWLHTENICTRYCNGNYFFSCGENEIREADRKYHVWAATLSVCSVHICAIVCIQQLFTGASISTNISRAMIFLCICKHFPWKCVRMRKKGWNERMGEWVYRWTGNMRWNLEKSKDFEVDELHLHECQIYFGHSHKHQPTTLIVLYSVH